MLKRHRNSETSHRRGITNVPNSTQNPPKMELTSVQNQEKYDLGAFSAPGRVKVGSRTPRPAPPGNGKSTFWIKSDIPKIRFRRQENPRGSKITPLRLNWRTGPPKIEPFRPCTVFKKKGANSKAPLDAPGL